MLRRWVLAIVLSVVAGGARAEGPALDPATAKADADGIHWYDIRALGVEGQGWKEVQDPFDRLPAKAEGVAPKNVWILGKQSAGLCVRFVTDAPSIDARWTVTLSRLAMNHMAATGVSGLDLYARLPTGRWHWLGVGRPDKLENKGRLAAGLPAGAREYLLYLPLYNGVRSVEIGIPKGAKLSRAEERPVARRKPIVFYGTSITQGGCASRPGMVHTAILGRKLEMPVINLGFSGSGRMEPEMARLFAELDPSVFVLDCLPNMNGALVKERVEPFVRILREKRPKTPIVLVEDRSYAAGALLAGPREHNAANRKELKAAFARLTAAGVKGLHYIPGDRLIGDDGEGTVDSSHPTDLGFLRQAEVFLERLAPLVK